jgi:hypothetical protein
MGEKKQGSLDMTGSICALTMSDIMRSMVGKELEAVSIHGVMNHQYMLWILLKYTHNRMSDVYGAVTLSVG